MGATVRSEDSQLDRQRVSSDEGPKKDAFR